MWENTDEVARCPAHLRSAEAISGTFGVSRATVKKWVREGAPISFVGRKYQADYTSLCAWLVTAYHGSRNIDGVC